MKKYLLVISIFIFCFCFASLADVFDAHTFKVRVGAAIKKEAQTANTIVPPVKDSDVVSKFTIDYVIERLFGLEKLLWFNHWKIRPFFGATILPVRLNNLFDEQNSQWFSEFYTGLDFMYTLDKFNKKETTAAIVSIQKNICGNNSNIIKVGYNVDKLTAGLELTNKSALFDNNYKLGFFSDYIVCEKKDVIYIQLIPDKKNVKIKVNDKPLDYSINPIAISISENDLPLLIKVSVPEDDENYKDTILELNSYQNGATYNLQLKSKLSTATQKLIVTLVKIIMTAYNYAVNNDLSGLKNIDFGELLSLTNTIGELPKLDAVEQKKIADLIKQNIKLENKTVEQIVTSAIGLTNNIIIKYQAKDLTAADQASLNRELINSFKDLIFLVAEIIKKNEIK